SAASEAPSARVASAGVASAGSRTLRSWRQCWSSGHPLDDEGHTLSAADAQGGQAELAIALAKAIDQGGGHAGTGGAPGVAERDRPAMDVERVVVDAEVLGRRDDLRGEGFVQLDQVHVVDAEAGIGQRPPRGLDRAQTHD